MSNALLYVVAHEAAPGLLEIPGAPAELIVRREGMEVPESALAGARIFVLSKLKGRHVLCLSARVRAAAELIEGNLAGAYLVELSPEMSIQTTTLERAGAWVVSGVSVPVGSLVECPLEFEQALLARVRSGWVTRTALPASSGEPQTLEWSPSHASARAAVVRVLRSRPLDLMERYVGHRDLSPIGSEAFRAVQLANDRVAEEFTGLLAVCDPLVSGADQPTSAAIAQRSVDTSFNVVDPDLVVARRFVAKEGEDDADRRLERLERSEAVHQRAVRRLALGLLAAGYQPLASTSIDLAFRAQEALVVLEVKSVNPVNLERQLLSAIGQLLLYESQLIGEEPARQLRGAVVLASEGPLKLADWCGELVKRARVGLYHVLVPPPSEAPLVEWAMECAKDDSVSDGG